MSTALSLPQQLQQFLSRGAASMRGSYSTIFQRKRDSVLLKRMVDENEENRVELIDYVLEHDRILDEMDPPREIFGAKIIRTYFPVPFHDGPYTGIFMRNNGISLDKLGSANYETVWNAVPDLIQGLVMLSSRGLIHGDIKLSNIVWDGQRLRLIDFDLLHSYEDSMETYKKNCENCTFDLFSVGPEVMLGNIQNYYYIWPLDRLYNPSNQRFMFNPSSSISIDNFKFLLKSLETTKKEYSSFMRFIKSMSTTSSTTSSKSSWVGEVIQFYSSPCEKLYDPTKFDIYSLGVTLSHIFPQENPNWPLIRKMIHPDPSHRPTPSEAYQAFVYYL